jgi:hypothetical protein
VTSHCATGRRKDAEIHGVVAACLPLYGATGRLQIEALFNMQTRGPSRRGGASAACASGSGRSAEPLQLDGAKVSPSSRRRSPSSFSQGLSLELNVGQEPPPASLLFSHYPLQFCMESG